MVIQNNPYLIWQVIPGIILLGVAIYVQTRPVKKDEAQVFMLTMFGGALWAFASAIQLITPDLAWQRFWNGVTYLGVMLVPTAWFLLSVKLTGIVREAVEQFEKWLWLIPAFLYLLLITSSWHHLFFKDYLVETTGGYIALKNEYGPLFYIHTGYSYFLMIAGILFLVASLATDFKRYGVQGYGLLLGVLAPLIGNIYYLFGSMPAGFPDPTPIIFTVTGITFAWAIFGGRLFEVVPMAHDAIVQKLTTGIVILDLQKRIRDINPAAVGMLGLSGKSHIGESIKKLGENNPTVAKAIESMLVDGAGDERGVVEVRIIETDRSFDLLVSRIEDDQGIIGGWLIQFTDISGQKQAEENLISTQKTLKLILDTLQDGFFEANENGVITYANRAFIQYLGFSKWEEVQGKNFRRFINRKNFRDIFEKFKTLYHSRQPLPPFEHTYRTKEGKLFIGETTVSPIMYGDRVIGTRGLIRDVTARVKTERAIFEQKELLDSLMQQAPIAMVINDMEKKISMVNPAFEKLFGYAREEAVGNRLDDLISPDQMQSNGTELSTILMSRRALREGKRKRKDGSFVNVDMFSAPFFVGGERFGYLAFYTNISERIKAEDALREAKDAAEDRARQLAVINRIADAVGQSLDLNDILQSVCVELTEIFEIRNAGIGVLTPDKKSLEIVAFHAVDPEEKSALGMILPVEGNTSSMEVIERRTTIVIQDAQSDPRTSSIADISRSRGTRSIMIVPLLARGEAIGTIGLPAKNPAYVFTAAEIDLAETIASQIAAAVDNAQLYEKTESALDVAERDLEIGRQIQSGFFPEELPRIPGWEIAAHFHAARQVAGDFYDIFQFKNSNHIAFIIADVCDKGVGAALFMVLFRSLLRAFSEIKINIETIHEQIQSIIVNTNNFISEYHGRSNMFATMFFGVLDPDTGIMYYINGGHEPPIVVNKSGGIIKRLMPTGPAVGLFPEMPFKVDQFQLNEGDFMVGFTDGTTDARNAMGVQFSEPRLLKTVSYPWTSIFSLLFELNIELQTHIGDQKQFDDITLISLRRKTSEEDGKHAICRPAVMQHLEELRDFTESAAVHSGLKSDEIFAFKLAVDEVCANIIQYGYEHHEPGLLSLVFTIDGGKAQLIIRDDGKYFEPSQAKHPDVEANWEDREIGGLGLFFVQELMDNVTYNRTEQGFNQLILEKKLITKE